MQQSVIAEGMRLERERSAGDLKVIVRSSTAPLLGREVVHQPRGGGGPAARRPVRADDKCAPALWRDPCIEGLYCGAALALSPMLFDKGVRPAGPARLAGQADPIRMKNDSRAHIWLALSPYRRLSPPYL